MTKIKRCDEAKSRSRKIGEGRGSPDLRLPSVWHASRRESQRRLNSAEGRSFECEPKLRNVRCLGNSSSRRSPCFHSVAPSSRSRPRLGRRMSHWRRRHLLDLAPMCVVTSKRVNKVDLRPVHPQVPRTPPCSDGYCGRGFIIRQIRLTKARGRRGSDDRAAAP